jgi:imidazolonepropionase-like amidohydrolase
VSLLLVLSAALLAQENPETIVLKGARVVTLAANEFESGIVVLEGGKIRRIGSDVEVPAGARIIELPKSAVVLPGFIDLHSHLGSAFDVEEPTEALTPQVKAVEAFTSRHRDVRAALGSGVTTVALAPGNGNLVGGRIGAVKLTGERYDRALLRDAVALKVSLGAEALRRDREPTSYAGALRVLREYLKNPESDVKSLPIFIHANTSAEIQNALALTESFAGTRVILHAREARLVPVGALKGTTIAFGPLGPGDPREILETPAAISKAGGRLAFVSDAPVTAEDHLRVTAAFAVKYGLDRQEALRGLTVVPAEALGLAKQMGTLEPGKDADLVVWSGDPLALSSSVELVIVNGIVTFRKGKP